MDDLSRSKRAINDAATAGACTQDVTAVAASARARSRQKSDRYLVAADAPATVRAYTADWMHFSSWCAGRDLVPMPASPAMVGDYLSDLGEGYARSTLRRKVAAIARANRHAGHRLDTGHPCIRDLLRGIGRTHGGPPKRAQALATEEIQLLVAVCDDRAAGLRARALLLVAFAGALRRSELCAIELEHISWHPRSIELPCDDDRAMLDLNSESRISAVAGL